MSTRVAVITGASQGLGRAFAHRLAAEGALVVLLARGPERLQAAVAEITRAGGKALGLRTDVTDPASVQAAAARVQAELGRVDLLIHSAGLCTPGRVQDSSTDQLVGQVAVGLVGSMLSTRAFLPLLGAGARILFVTSPQGLLSTAGYAACAAASGGLIRFAEALRSELRPRQITVQVALPWAVDTPGHRRRVAALPGPQARTGRPRATPADEAARSILARCRGRGFLLFTEARTRLLELAARLAPWLVRCWVSGTRNEYFFENTHS